MGSVPHRAPPPTHTYQGLHLTSWVPKCHCPAAKGTDTLGSSLTPQTNPLNHSCIIHWLLPSFPHMSIHPFIGHTFAQFIHLQINSDYLLANPCIHSFMWLTDLNVKSISFINSVHICNQHLLCARHCLRLRGHRVGHRNKAAKASTLWASIPEEKARQTFQALWVQWRKVFRVKRLKLTRLRRALRLEETPLKESFSEKVPVRKAL